MLSIHLFFFLNRNGAVDRLVGKRSMPDRGDADIVAPVAAAPDDDDDDDDDDDAAATLPFIMASFSASLLARSDLPFHRVLSIMRIMKRSVEQMARRNDILWHNLWEAGGMFSLDRLGCTYSYACSAGRLSCRTSSSLSSSSSSSSSFSAGCSSQGSPESESESRTTSKEGLCMADGCPDAGFELMCACSSSR